MTTVKKTKETSEMQLFINKDVEINKWQDTMNAASCITPFQTPAFYDYFNSIEGFSADVFAIENEGVYKALLVVTIQKEKGLRAVVSKRGIIYGGPLLTGQNKNELKELLRQVRKYYQSRLIYLEVRNSFNFSEYSSIYHSMGFQYEPWLNFLVDCTDLEAWKKAASSSRIRQIKKAVKNSAVWREAANLEEVIDFYNILNDLYANVIKKPLWPEEAFRQFFELKMGKFLLVFYEEKVIGGIMCAFLPGHASYELYVCGLDEQYKEQYPSVMATWAAIEYSHQNGIPVFDFMGAGSPKIEYGVREFKSRFGGKMIEYGRYILIFNPLLYHTAKLGLSLIKKIK